MFLRPTCLSLLLLISASLAAFVGPTARGVEAPPKVSGPGKPVTSDTAAEKRNIKLNGRPATKHDLEILARFERTWGVQVPPGSYWYDNASGSSGLWGGPTRGFLGAGLGLGGTKLPANASGGGNGALTGVFINGRELHPADVKGLTLMLGQAPWPGRWWVDGQGNFGPDGFGPIGNLLQVASKRQGSKGGSSYYKSDVGTGSSTFVGSGCAAVTQRLRPSESDSSYSYYVGCE